jgi:excisionase family DNA binding protein
MKIELEKEDIKAIAAEVIEGLKPLLEGNGNPQDEDTIFDVEELANYLRVDEGWIYDKVSAKAIPYFKAGKYLRFKKPAVDKWIERNTVKPTSPLDLVRIGR